jgi:hypothetical protein
MKPLTLLHGIDLRTGAARGVDGLLILLGGGGGCLLPHNDRLPVLPDRSDPGHPLIPPSQSLSLRSLHGSLSRVSHSSLSLSLLSLFSLSLSLSLSLPLSRRNEGNAKWRRRTRRRYRGGRGSFWIGLGYLRLSATVTPKFFPLYHFFTSHHQHFIPYFFISRSGSPYILPLYPTTTIKYHFLYLLFIYYQFFSI